MARPRRVPLDVFLNGRAVGTLSREASGAISFRYDERWLTWEYTFPISLSLPLREDRYSGDPVIAVFENLLPDNKQAREKLAARKQAGGTDAYHLLMQVGRDCVGALQFLPAGEEPAPPGIINAKALDEQGVEALLSELGLSPLGRLQQIKASLPFRSRYAVFPDPSPGLGTARRARAHRGRHRRLRDGAADGGGGRAGRGALSRDGRLSAQVS